MQALVLCPTRELADQVTQEIRRLARAADNIKVSAQWRQPHQGRRSPLAFGAHIAVGTPGRLIDHLERGTLDLAALNTWCWTRPTACWTWASLTTSRLYRQTRAGPKRQTPAVLGHLPRGREGHRRHLSCAEPATVKVAGSKEAAAPASNQIAFEVTESQRLDAVPRIAAAYRPESTPSPFCNTKQQCRDLEAVLAAQGFVAMALHGDLEQRDRDQVLIQFANRSAFGPGGHRRGRARLDIANLACVINVDVSADVSSTSTVSAALAGRAAWP